MSQNSRNQGFLTIQYLLNDRRIRIREAQKHVDPVDPDPDSDPEHCLKVYKFRLGSTNLTALAW
jgi:hypothetical protein